MIVFIIWAIFMILVLVAICLFTLDVCSFNEGFHFHKWKDICSIHNKTFRGRSIPCPSIEYRTCPVCGLVQDFMWDSQGGSWSYVGDDAAKIIKEDMYEKEGMLFIDMRVKD